MVPVGLKEGGGEVEEESIHMPLPSCLTMRLKATVTGALGVKVISSLWFVWRSSLWSLGWKSLWVSWPVVAQIFPIYSAAVALIYIKVAGLACFYFSTAHSHSYGIGLEKAFQCLPGSKVDLSRCSDDCFQNHHQLAFPREMHQR